MAFVASRGLPDMLNNPLESLDASPRMSVRTTRGLMGGAHSLKQEGDPDLGLGESTKIGAGTDPAESGAVVDDPRRRNEDRDPDKAAKVSSSEDSNGSVSESGGTLARSFWVRLLPD